MNYNELKDDVFIVGCWPDTESKETTLINLIKRLKVYNTTIILCGHYPVKPEIQKMVDYFIYDSNNDILEEKDYSKFGIVSDRWTETADYKVINKVKFHHDYAIWLTMKNSFNLANQLGKKYIHYLEFDNLPDEFQYRQAFIEYIRSYDAVVQEYTQGSTQFDEPFCATYIFSIRTHIALSVVNKVNSKEEYFMNRPKGWQLEKVFYQTLKSVTHGITVSKYIPNDNEFNTHAAWNRDCINRNGAKFQTYICIDDSNTVHLHFISGFDNDPADKNYLVEIQYKNKSGFYTVFKDQYQIQNIGEYQENETIKVFYQGIEVFSETLPSDMDDFKRKNQLIWKTKQKEPHINLNFIDGPFVEILDDIDRRYNVKFINKKNDKVEYELELKNNHWARCAKKYKIDWLIRIEGIDNKFFFEHHFDCSNKRVLISFESKSLGDNIAWMAYAEEFRLKNDCKLICSTFHNSLFINQYPDIEFVEPGSNVHDIYALYRIGVFYDNNRNIEYGWHKTDPKKEPLCKIASDILGLDYTEIKTRLPFIGKNKKKRVSIAIHSTSQCKYWNNPNGWQDVVDHLNKLGYEVRLLSREEDGYMGNKNPVGVVQQPASSTIEILKVIQESELFIGISSGLSWLAWATGVPVVLISGFTDESLEPFDGISRIINKDVCNGCWSNYVFDPGDWNWCPVHKDTDRQFECSKTITSEQVINEINRNLKITSF